MNICLLALRINIPCHKVHEKRILLGYALLGALVTRLAVLFTSDGPADPKSGFTPMDKKTKKFLAKLEEEEKLKREEARLKKEVMFTEWEVMFTEWKEEERLAKLRGEAILKRKAELEEEEKKKGEA